MSHGSGLRLLAPGFCYTINSGFSLVLLLNILLLPCHGDPLVLIHWIFRISIIRSAGSHILRLAHSCSNNRVSPTVLPRQCAGSVLPLTWPWANHLTYCKSEGPGAIPPHDRLVMRLGPPHSCPQACSPARNPWPMVSPTCLQQAGPGKHVGLHLLSPNGTRRGSGFSAGNVLIGCFFIFLSIVYRISSWFLQLLLLPIL